MDPTRTVRMVGAGMLLLSMGCAGTAKQPRLNTDWGEVHFAFTTADNSGAYNTSGVLHGTTHSLGRGFLAVWTAERTAPAVP